MEEILFICEDCGNASPIQNEVCPNCGGRMVASAEDSIIDGDEEGAGSEQLDAGDSTHISLDQLRQEEDTDDYPNFSDEY